MSSIEITKAQNSEFRKTSNPALSFVSIVTVALLSACGGGSGGSGGSSDDLSLAAALPDEELYGFIPDAGLPLGGIYNGS